MFEYQLADLIVQRLLFDENRSWMETEFRLKIVGFVANQRHVSESVTSLLKLSAESFPGRMLYFEPIGFRIF